VKRALTTGIFWCAAVLFTGGAAVGLRFGGGAANWLWIWRDEVHPLVLVYVVAPWMLYMGITGLTAFLVWDYRRDRWPSSPDGESSEKARSEGRGGEGGRPAIGAPTDRPGSGGGRKTASPWGTPP
jgi:hypothetical protein